MRPFTAPNSIEVIHPGLTVRIFKDEKNPKKTTKNPKPFHLKEIENQRLVPMGAALHTPLTVSNKWVHPREGLVPRLDLPHLSGGFIICLQQISHQGSNPAPLHCSCYSCTQNICSAAFMELLRHPLLTSKLCNILFLMATVRKRCYSRRTSFCAD